METETPQIVTDYLAGRVGATRAIIRHNFRVVALPGLSGWALIRTDSGKGSRFAGMYERRDAAISAGVQGVGR